MEMTVKVTKEIQPAAGISMAVVTVSGQQSAYHSPNKALYLVQVPNLFANDAMAAIHHTPVSLRQQGAMHVKRWAI